MDIKSLYIEYKDDLYRYLISITNNPSLSEDIVSETFLTALKSLQKFKGQSSIKTWLFSIARYKWYEYLRKNKIGDSLDSMAGIYLKDGVNIEESLITKETIERIYQLLSQEDERKKDVILMRIQGYSFLEIAEKHNISESSARVLHMRVKNKIREALEE